MKIKSIKGKYIHSILGKGVEDSFGLIWFKTSKKQYNYYEALEYAKSLNVGLPTKEEIQYNINNRFNLGKKDFWSSSAHANNPDLAFLFYGYYGRVVPDVRNFTNNYVKCVIHRSVLFNNKLNELLEE